jgi:hypothetical protein
MGKQQDIYAEFKKWTLDPKGDPQKIGLDIDQAYGNQCVDMFLGIAKYYFPGINYRILVPVMGSAKYAGTKRNDQYFEWISNNHSDVNQLPQQGDILVADSTPQPGYSNQTHNPDGHLGIVESADRNGYTLLQQDGSNPKGKPFLGQRPWKYRPVLGWLRPRLAVAVDPVPQVPSQPAPQPPKPSTLSRDLIGKRVYLNLRSDFPAFKPGTNEIRARLDSKNIPAARSYVVRDIDTLPNSVLIQSGQFGTLAIHLSDGATVR